MTRTVECSLSWPKESKKIDQHVGSVTNTEALIPTTLYPNYGFFWMTRMLRSIAPSGTVVFQDCLAH